MGSKDPAGRAGLIRFLRLRDHRLLPGGAALAEDPAVAPLLMEYERRSQRATGILLFLVGPVFFGIAFGIASEPLRQSGLVSGVERVGYTVHGAAVNLAALDPTDAASFFTVGRIPVRGRTAPVEVFTPLGGAGMG